MTTPALPTHDEKGIWWNARCKPCNWEGQMLIYITHEAYKAKKELWFCPYCGQKTLMPFLYTKK